MTTFGLPHHHVAQCASTNDLAREWATRLTDAAPSGALVTADFQTRGRGQRGRDWQAGFGQSALMSFIYHPPPALPEIGQLGLVIAVAVAEALEAAAGLSPQIKWPNDLLLDGKKVAGILVESLSCPVLPEQAGSRLIAILGIGVNVNQERFVGGEAFVYPPTSLRLASGQTGDVASIVEATAHRLTHWEERWRTDGFMPVVQTCRTRLAVGATVKRGETQAELIGLGTDGGAEVRLRDGTFGYWRAVD